MTKDFLKQYILAMLGASQTDVELADSDLDMIIYHTINYYGHNSSEAWNEEWTVLRLKAGTNLHLVPDDIDFIISINQQKGGGGVTLIPETTGKAYEITMLGMITNDNALQKVTNSIPTRILHKNGKRYFQTDVIQTSDTNVAAKVMKYKDLAPIYGDPWVQKYALAQAKFNLGIIRSKYSGLSAPNDLSMNGSDLISQAQTEIEKLEQELYDKSVLDCGGIYIG
jgi:hypothetical protein